MKLIAHRGNTKGPNAKFQNRPEYILAAAYRGYDVEIDVWYVDKKWFLGHDKPLYEVEKEFFKNEQLWCHAKNLEALQRLNALNAHCFWHQEDDYTLTSRGHIWTYPGKKTCTNGVIVIKDKETTLKMCENNEIYGICSDYVGAIE